MKPPVDTAQTTWELDQLLTIVQALDPISVLEIGVWEGGTLWHWLQIASHVVAIDDTMRDPGPDVWNAWAAEAGCVLELLHGKSQEQAIIEAARGTYDMVFIDADHTYQSVKADWENYADMVAGGGVCVFHDITPRDEYGVSELWGEIKTAHRTVEIVDGGGRFNGIGVCFL